MHFSHISQKNTCLNSNAFKTVPLGLCSARLSTAVQQLFWGPFTGYLCGHESSTNSQHSVLNVSLRQPLSISRNLFLHTHPLDPSALKMLFLSLSLLSIFRLLVENLSLFRPLLSGILCPYLSAKQTLLQLLKDISKPTSLTSILTELLHFRN